MWTLMGTQVEPTGDSFDGRDEQTMQERQTDSPVAVPVSVNMHEGNKLMIVRRHVRRTIYLTLEKVHPTRQGAPAPQATAKQ